MELQNNGEKGTEKEQIEERKGRVERGGRQNLHQWEQVVTAVLLRTPGKGSTPTYL